jgi:hypothetical protein
MKKKGKGVKKTSVKKRTARKKSSDDALKDFVMRDLAHAHRKRTESESKMYRFGFWLFFVLVILSVGFGVWAISSIYENFAVVTKILDESFERTNLVLDITSSKISSCEHELKTCQAGNGSALAQPVPG